MRKLLLFATLLISLASGAQKIPNPKPYAATITAGDLKKQLYIVAGREMEGRETGSPGERRAAIYIENEFKRIGLEPGNKGSFQMMYNTYQDSLLEALIVVNNQPYSLGIDFTSAPGNTNAGYRFSEVIVAGPGSADSLKNANLAGRLVLLITSANGKPAGPTEVARLVNLVRSKGPTAILVTSSNFPARVVNRKSNAIVNLFRRSYSPQEFSVSTDLAKAILKEEYALVDGNPAYVKTHRTRISTNVSTTQLTVPTSNVIGIIPGTDLKDQYLVLTAHHDHIGKRGDTVINYGADDDGSGTVAIIEMAEAFAKAKAEGKGPRRTIVFMTVSGEEKGLWGSDYYVNNPIYQLDKTTANLNIDMIGRIDPSRKTGDSTNYVYVVGDDKLSSDLKPISESINKRFSNLELDYKFNDPKDPQRIYFRSDHYNFAKMGVPVIFYFNGTHADYHRPTDTPDKINFDLHAKRAQFVFFTAWEMANRNDMLKRDIPLDSTLVR